MARTFYKLSLTNSKRAIKHGLSKIWNLIKATEKGIRSFAYIILYGALILFIILGTMIIFKDVNSEFHQDLVMDFGKFELPPKLLEEGYSSSNVAQKIMDQINGLRGPAKFRNLRNEDYPKLLIQEPMDYKVPVVNLAINDISTCFLKIFGKYPYKVEGEIINKNDSLELTIRISKEKKPYVRELCSFAGSNGEIDSLFYQAAFYIVNYFEPIPLAAHYIFNQEKALPIIKYGLTHDPAEDDAIYYSLWGNILYTANNYSDDSFEKFQRAIKLDPNYDEPYRGIAVYYQKKNDSANAAKYFQKALKLDSLNINTLERWGLFLLEKQNYDSAITVFNNILIIDPYFVNASTRIAFCLYSKGLVDSSISLFMKTEELYKLDARGYKDYATALEKTYNYLNAGEMYIAASNTDSGYKRFFRGYALKLITIDSIRILNIIAEKCINSKILAGDGYALLGMQENNIGHWSKAKGYFEKAIESDSSNMIFYMQLGMDYAKLEEYDKSLSACKKLLGTDSSYNGIFYEISKLIFARKEYDKAVPFLIEAVAANPKNKDAYIDLGRCYFNLSDYSNAANYFKSAIAIDSTDMTACILYATSMAKIGHIDEAYDLFIKASNLEGNSDLSKLAKSLADSLLNIRIISK